MTERELTCIVCPIGCRLTVTDEGDGASVTGQGCAEGVDYGRLEHLDPRRVVTSTVLVVDGEWPLVSVRTSIAVPKDRIMDVMQEIRGVRANAPVSTGDILVQGIAGTAADLVATKDVGKSESSAEVPAQG